MQTVHETGTPAMWITFAVVVVTVLVLDLGVIHRRGSKHSFKRAAIWAGFCISLAFAFALWIRHESGNAKALDFTTAYLLEEALSIDNLFVFLILFRALAVPAEHQHRVLFWGILGAILTRGAFIAAGTALVSNFEWIFWIFGAILLVTGVKLLKPGDSDPHPERSPIARLFMRVFPMTRDYRGGAFLVREGGRTLATPLMLALVAAEATDIVFAVDSIPAVFGITSDPFIVYTSNIFAILGLRSLYTLLAGVMDKFHYLKVGLAFVLIFIGAKMLVKEAFHWQIGTAWALLVLVVLLGGSIVASLLRPPAPPTPPQAVPPA